MCMTPRLMSSAQTTPLSSTLLYLTSFLTSQTLTINRKLFIFFLQNLFPYTPTKPIFPNVSRKPNQLSVTQIKTLGSPLGSTLSFSPSYLSQN